MSVLSRRTFWRAWHPTVSRGVRHSRLRLAQRAHAAGSHYPPRATHRGLRLGAEKGKKSRSEITVIRDGKEDTKTESVVLWEAQRRTRRNVMGHKTGDTKKGQMACIYLWCLHRAIGGRPVACHSLYVHSAILYGLPFCISILVCALRQSLYLHAPVVSASGHRR